MDRHLRAKLIALITVWICINLQISSVMGDCVPACQDDYQCVTKTSESPLGDQTFDDCILITTTTTPALTTNARLNDTSNNVVCSPPCATGLECVQDSSGLGTFNVCVPVTTAAPIIGGQTSPASSNPTSNVGGGCTLTCKENAQCTTKTFQTSLGRPITYELCLPITTTTTFPLTTNSSLNDTSTTDKNVVCSPPCTDGLQKCVQFSTDTDLGKYTRNICVPVTVNTKGTTTPTIPHDPSHNVCDPGYVFHNLSERTCGLSLICYYGKCLKAENKAICLCDPGADSKDHFCNKKCCKYCGEQGYCRNNGTEYCVCSDADYKVGPDDICVYSPPPEVEAQTWHWWVVGSCAVALVLILAVLVVVLYVMWRHRVILIMKVVHYFQGYEDDDEREWDAFISYKGNTPDEEFVVKTLFPKLAREMGFNVNVHFKDFVPGEDISDGIINAVERSRRTIMVVSPHYLTSSWTKFEWQMAQQKMLEKKHRIIPILLDDVTQHEESMDANLKLILNSVTYLEWPRCGTDKKVDKFWKRLELSMPKKRGRSECSPNAQPSSEQKHELSSNDVNGNDGKLALDVYDSEVYDTIDDAVVADDGNIYNTITNILARNEDNKLPNEYTFVTITKL